MWSLWALRVQHHTEHWKVDGSSARSALSQLIVRGSRRRERDEVQAGTADLKQTKNEQRFGMR